MQGLQSIAATLKEKNVEIIAISADPLNKLDELAKDKEFSFPLVSDPDLVAINKMGLRHANGNAYKKTDIARPAMFLLSENRDILWEEYPDNWRKRPTAEEIIRNVENGGQRSGY